MKKTFLQIGILVIGLLLSFSSLKASDSPVFSTVDSSNAVIETCTGTWCGYCPCGHQYLVTILSVYPNTVVMCYHGGSTSDPWYTIGQPMINLFGMTSYPTGVVNRASGIINRSAWFGSVSAYASYAPGVRIQLSNATINPTTRVVTGRITATALTELTGAYSLYAGITENNIVYQQTIYTGCGTAGINYSYVHDHVFKGSITPNTGIQLTAGPWHQDSSYTYDVNYTVPAGVDLNNMDVNYFVFFNGSPYTTGATVQNGLKTPATAYTITGVGNLQSIPDKYNLGQNYPNPFNPTTNIRFTVPKDGNVVFKVYNIKGQEVATYLDGFLKAGAYNVTVDGNSLGSGVYFYKLTAGNFTDTKRMILVK
ncbi:MAG: Omp28-related outer membrane protein [Bacteroidetes bacterium]|nr:Omp28-related outer membrane protein [Bacteroidota bacterium]